MSELDIVKHLNRCVATTKALVLYARAVSLLQDRTMFLSKVSCSSRLWMCLSMVGDDSDEDVELASPVPLKCVFSDLLDMVFGLDRASPLMVRIANGMLVKVSPRMRLSVYDRDGLIARVLFPTCDVGEAVSGR